VFSFHLRRDMRYFLPQFRQTRMTTTDFGKNLNS
jgi:hypothetical protein